MCGIVGFFEHKKSHPLSILNAMLDSLTHRGPDASGCFFETINDNQAALGHRRLSIIDISTVANQPMSFDELVIVYNGEVYNFVEIRGELEKIGYSFNSKSDTEVILKAFHCWGIKSLEKFRGMFAFCILDNKNKKVYLVRDRSGVKPLYYSYSNNSLIFSSELKAFQFYPSFAKSLSLSGLRAYLQYGYITAPFSIFDGIKKIQPGHYLEYDLTHRKLDEKKYWDLGSYYHLPKIKMDENEATIELHTILSDSCLLRLIADVPVGVFLSGGIDSSLVASILQSRSTTPINTFTIGFEDQHYDESIFARNIANHLGTSHHEKICTWKEAEKIIFQIPRMYDEPFADSSCIPTALISAFAKQKVAVALSGDGGDELFCGYDTYPLNANRFSRMEKIPGKNIIGKLMHRFPDPIMYFFRMNYNLYNRYLKLKAAFLHQHVEDRYDAVIKTFTEFDLNKLLCAPQYNQSNNKTHDTLNSLERMMLFDFNQYLPDDLLVKVDRATMFYSLEGREPLLDHKILEFAAQMPIEFKFKKKILKTILSQYLPTSLFERKKQGFGIPVNQWLRKELNFLIKKYLAPDKLIRQGIFNHKYIKKLSEVFLQSKTNDNRIWTLLVFQMWYEFTFNETF